MDTKVKADIEAKVLPMLRSTNRDLMSVVQIYTKFPYDLYGLWEKDVHDQVLLLLRELPPFIVFSAYDDTYVYFPTISSQEIGHYCCSRVPDELMLRITPVMCYPSIDMSTTSVEDFAGDKLCFISDYISSLAVEDVTLGDVMIKHEVNDPKSDALSVPESDNDYALSSIVNDVYLRYLCRFVINVTRLSTYRNTVPLRSFVKYMFAKNGTALHYDALFPQDYDIMPKKHSIIELTSEMMKCNYDLYSKYKYGHSIALLEQIIASAKSKLEVEYAICGLVYTVLSDSVVTNAGKMWCFINGLWVECFSDGYLWNFITNELIQYLLSEGGRQRSISRKVCPTPEGGCSRT